MSKAPQRGIEPLRSGTKGSRFRLPPWGMSRAKITDEQFEAVQNIALGVFTDMSNCGFSLRETLAAIYLTGADNACAVLIEKGLMKQ